MSKSRTWTPLLNEMLADLWRDGVRPTELARIFDTAVGAIKGQAIRLQLHHQAVSGDVVRGLADTHPAAIDGRTLFPKAVIDPPGPKPWGDALNEGGHVLKSGANQRKLGPIVEKGAWRGFPIFSLSLEERATCPRECENWQRCMGNGMPFSKRYRHGPELERSLEHDLGELQRKFPGGFVVRLHLLGDFVSVAYVRLWRGWLEQFPALRVFGYTAWDWLSEIGSEVALLSFQHWDRFAVRLSGYGPGKQRAITIQSDVEKPAGSLICPAQRGRTAGCASCALCWSPAARNKTIAFIAHGPSWPGRRAYGQ